MDRSKLGWDMEEGGTVVKITYEGKTVMQFDVIQVVESSNRNYVLRHVVECDNTPWLTRWQKEKDHWEDVMLPKWEEKRQEEIVRKLKGFR